MIKPLIPQHELTRGAIEVLVRELGVVNTVRFLRRVSPSVGDYTAERHTWLSSWTIDDIAAEAIERTTEKGVRSS